MSSIEKGNPTENSNEPDPEILAITAVYSALRNLKPEAQSRVLKFVVDKIGADKSMLSAVADQSPRTVELEPGPVPVSTHSEISTSISPIAQKWIKRNNLLIDDLSKIFSVGGEEIDLIAKAIPGTSIRSRMFNVFLLKCIAAYLSSGNSRAPHQQLKETCLHYNAYDESNFAAYIKHFSSEFSGSKDVGYQLTQRGLSSAADLIRSMVSTDSSKD